MNFHYVSFKVTPLTEACGAQMTLMRFFQFVRGLDVTAQSTLLIKPTATVKALTNKIINQIREIYLKFELNF